ncbi:MAG: hypothetical protein N2043_02275 [Ignavibacterium sp.]|nr:hypothetical protein [Ignavibacterium sp.]
MFKQERIFSFTNRSKHKIVKEWGFIYSQKAPFQYLFSYNPHPLVKAIVNKKDFVLGKLVNHHVHSFEAKYFHAKLKTKKHGILENKPHNQYKNKTKEFQISILDKSKWLYIKKEKYKKGEKNNQHINVFYIKTNNQKQKLHTAIVGSPFVSVENLTKKHLYGCYFTEHTLTENLTNKYLYGVEQKQKTLTKKIQDYRAKNSLMHVLVFHRKVLDSMINKNNFMLVTKVKKKRSKIISNDFIISVGKEKIKSINHSIFSLQASVNFIKSRFLEINKYKQNKRNESLSIVFSNETKLNFLKPMQSKITENEIYLKKLPINSTLNNLKNYKVILQRLKTKIINNNFKYVGLQKIKSNEIKNVFYHANKKRVNSQINLDGFLSNKKRLKINKPKEIQIAYKKRENSIIHNGLEFVLKRYVRGIISPSLIRAKWEFDDIIGLFDKEDLLDIPNTDYPYEDGAVLVYDKKTGEPFKPIGEVNKNEVEVETPITHPFPQWEDEARKEIWVNTAIYQDTVLTLYGMWKKHSYKIGGMKTQRAFIFLLTELREWIRTYTNDNPEYLRVFRMIRWYAEPIVLSLKRTILVRYYDDWLDDLKNGNTFGEMDGFVVKNGVLESKYIHGYIEFEKESLIDGVFEFSYLFKNPSGNAKMKLYIDDNLIFEETSSRIQRKTIEVAKGKHKYRIQLEGANVGDVLKLSGFKITNTMFLYAETRYEEGEEERSKAHSSIHLLISQLVKYYQKHWGGDKDKGNMQLKQRKIWIEQ